MSGNVTPIRPGVDLASPAPVRVKVFRAVVTVYRGDPDDPDTPPAKSATIDLVDRWQGVSAEACRWLHDVIEPLCPGYLVVVHGGYIFDEVQ